jgi:hypothetical protein
MGDHYNAQNSADPNHGPAVSLAPSADGPLRHIAEQVAGCFAASGYAFIEEDRIDALTATLGSFLEVTGIPVNAAHHDDA